VPISHWFVQPFINGRVIVFGHCNQQVFERQFKLLDLAFNLFRRFAKSQFLQLGDPKAKRLNQLIMDPQRRRYLGVFCLQFRDHRLQNSGIIREVFSRFRHAPNYQKTGQNTI
jgi:hypothetical protein